MYIFYYSYNFIFYHYLQVNRTQKIILQKMYTFKLLNNSEILCRLLYNTRVWIKEFNLKQKMSLHSAVLYKEKPKDVKAEDTESVTASSS